MNSEKYDANTHKKEFGFANHLPQITKNTQLPYWNVSNPENCVTSLHQRHAEVTIFWVRTLSAEANWGSFRA